LTVSSGWLLLLIPGLIWGASFLFIAEGLRSVGPYGIAFLRILIGFATLACFPAARKPVDRADWLAIATLGVVWFAFPLTMFPLAEQRVSSAMTGMLNGANPLFTVIVAALIARRAPTASVLLSLAIGIAGTVLIAIPALGEGKSSMVGIVMIMSALLSYGVALNVAHPLQQKYGGTPVIWRGQMVGMMLTAPIGISEVLQANWSPVPLLSLIALGALGTGVAYVAMATAAGRFGAARASGTTFLIPVVALALGVILRNERVEWISVLGCLVCLSGAWLMKRASSN
jgi:drug/metabolite transporter (DMT)-like permease